jgi:hypothetical protein
MRRYSTLSGRSSQKQNSRACEPGSVFAVSPLLRFRKGSLQIELSGTVSPFWGHMPAVVELRGAILIVESGFSGTRAIGAYFAGRILSYDYRLLLEGARQRHPPGALVVLGAR